MIKRHHHLETSNNPQNKMKDLSQNKQQKHQTFFHIQKQKKEIFEKQNWIQSDMTFYQDPHLTQSKKLNTSNRNNNLKNLCSQCFIYSLKLQQLTSSYQQLLLCKNEQIKNCRQIMGRLQQKNKEIQLKYKLQIDKNRKFKQYVQTKSFNQNNSKKKQINQSVQYLKKREASLIDNLTKIQKELYVKQLHLKDEIQKIQPISTYSSEAQNNQQLLSDSEKYQQLRNQEYTLNDKFEHQIQLKQKLVQLPKISMNEYIKKCNQLQLARDQNLILIVQSKINNVKHLQKILLKK